MPNIGCSRITGIWRQLGEQCRAVDVPTFGVNPAYSLSHLDEYLEKTATVWVKMTSSAIIAVILNISKTLREGSANTGNVWRKRRAFRETWGMFEEDLGIS